MSLILGPQIAEGAQHKIYEDPDDQLCVIKIPKPGNRFTLGMVSHDLALIRQHFAKWALPSEAVPHQQNYYIRQERFHPAEHVRPPHITIPDVRTNIEDIVQSNQRAMRDNGVKLDFLGTRGTARGLQVETGELQQDQLELMNVLIGTRGKIALCGLLFHFRNTSGYEKMNARVSTALHRYFIKKHFGIDIDPRQQR